MEDPEKKVERIKKYQWPKGVSGNPNGRPEGGISPKNRIIAMFRENPDGFDEWLEEYITDPRNRKHVVELLDGKPHQSVDVTSGGKELPIPILQITNVLPDQRNAENTGDVQENQGSAGGNVSE